MRNFYVNANLIQKSYDCPVGVADCPAIDFLRAVPDLHVKYITHDKFNIDIVVGPVTSPWKAGEISFVIRQYCHHCPNYSKMRLLKTQNIKQKWR